jgi:1,4-alpha-glucan branching enzyme
MPDGKLVCFMPIMYYFSIVKSSGKSRTKGFLLLVLHAHLPYLRYPEHEHHLEENWLYEAITESYIPLLQVFDTLINDKVDFRITLSLTPTLLEMFSDSLLMSRYQRHMERLIDLAEKEVARCTDDHRVERLARMYRARLIRTKHLFEDRYGGNIVAAFSELAESGTVEIITSCATHAYLPAHMSEPAVVRAQISLAARSFVRHFGKRPAGIWLPECGYAPGMDAYVSEAGIGYFFLEGHGILNSTPGPSKSIYAPVRTPSGSAVFARDPESARQVWSSAGGYPGDPDYRDFFRDIGFDLDYEYVRPYLPGGERTFTGIKYFRITGGDDRKEPYVPEMALNKARIHAGHFVDCREHQITELRERIGIAPVVTAAFDAELFGHWWYEGPEWLGAVLRNCASREKTLRLVTPSEYISENHDFEIKLGAKRLQLRMDRPVKLLDIPSSPGGCGDDDLPGKTPQESTGRAETGPEPGMPGTPHRTGKRLALHDENGQCG